MSYSLNINQGNNTVSIPSRRALAGYTLKLVLDRGGSSAPVEITSGLTVSGQSVSVSTAGRLSDFSGSDYILQGTKNGVTDVLQNGHIYRTSSQAATGADDVNVVNSPSVTVTNPVTSVGVTGNVNVVPPAGGTLVGTIQTKYREEFMGSALDTNMWEVVQTGTGQTVSVASSVLSIVSGTTANATTVIRSKKSWTGAYRVMFLSAALMSARIANHEVQLRMTNAAGTSYAAWVFNGTNAIAGVMRSQAGGVLGTDQSSGAISSTAAPSIFEIENFIDEVYFHSRSADSTNARSTSNVKNRLTPDPNEDMFIEIRVINGATAPASSVTVNFDSILIQDISELTTEITGGRGAGGASQAIPVVQVAAAPASNVTTGSTSVVNPIADSNTVTSTAQAANATMTGTTIDGGTGASSRSNRVRFTYQATAATFGSIAHLVFQESADGTTWREVWRSPMPADGGYHTGEIGVRNRYRRWQVINGSTAQTGLFLVEKGLSFDGPIDTKVNLSIPLSPAAGSALAASQIATYPTLDLGANHSWDKIRAVVSTDQTGTVGVQQSIDNSFWFFVDPTFGNTALVANTQASRILEVSIAARYIRVVVTNGTTATTATRVIADLVSL